jgi:phosphoribosyl 1,2-cyclic phosphodiesterase
LGTGGARFMVARQLRASGGFWLTFADPASGIATQIHVDPGPGALVRALACVPACDPSELDAIVLSHKHLDHSGDVNAMIEAMTQGGWRPRGAILAPLDAFQGEYVILPYAQGFVPVRHVLEPQSGPYSIGDVSMRTSLPHRHSVETYGMHFSYRGTTLSYVPCGRYFAELTEDYKRHAPDALIVNVLRYDALHEADHLTFADARLLIGGVRPKVAVLTHFGTTMLEHGPERLARSLEDELGLRVLAARDGWTLDVDTEVAASHG